MVLTSSYVVKSHEKRITHVKVFVLIREKPPKIVAFAVKSAVKS
jgi:hypothetical protein